MHPTWRRCSSLKYCRYSRSSRLASRAPRRPPCCVPFMRWVRGAGRRVSAGVADRTALDRLRRRAAARLHERDVDGSDRDHVAAPHVDDAIDRLAVEERPVLAVEILVGEPAGRHDDAAVDAGHARVVDANQLIAAADDVAPWRQLDPLIVPPRLPAGRPAGARRRGRSGLDEGVAEPMHGAHEPRRVPRIPERRPHFADEVREVGLDHENAGPDGFHQLLLAERPRPRRDQHFQEVVGLRREPHRARPATQHPRIRIDVQTHRTRNASPARLLRSRQRSNGPRRISVPKMGGIT